MIKKLQFRKASVAILLTASLIGGVAQSVKAADVIVSIVSSTSVSGTVTIKYTNGSSTVSAPLWTGSVPTSISGYSGYQSCQYLKFPIKASLAFETMKSDVSVKFEIWTTAGEKLASNTVSYTDWNPIDGPTMLSWLECDDWLTVGTHNLVITTQQTLSTNGLLSRYVEGKQTFPFVINPVISTTTTSTTTTTIPRVTTTVAPATTTLAPVTITLAPVVQNTVAYQPAVTVAKKPVVKKITCVKGKKKITTTKKTCPKGYKKK